MGSSNVYKRSQIDPLNSYEFKKLIRLPFSHPDCNCRFWICTKSACAHGLWITSSPPIGNFTLPWRICLFSYFIR